MKFYYSTQAYLAWCFSRYFYNGRHRVYIGEHFYPYRLPNPKSSNPFLIYQDLYQPWKDQDDFDKFIAQTRLNIRKGVHHQMRKGAIKGWLARWLKKFSSKVDITFLYPIVYRVDINSIKPRTRLKTAGSGLVGSHEFLIEDLDEHKREFVILFQDFSGDADFDRLKVLPVGDRRSARRIFEGRCKP